MPLAVVAVAHAMQGSRTAMFEQKVRFGIQTVLKQFHQWERVSCRQAGCFNFGACYPQLSIEELQDYSARIWSRKPCFVKAFLAVQAFGV